VDVAKILFVSHLILCHTGEDEIDTEQFSKFLCQQKVTTLFPHNKKELIIQITLFIAQI